MYDRVGYQRRATIGYGGGIDLVDRITNAILDHVDAQSSTGTVREVVANPGGAIVGVRILRAWSAEDSVMIFCKLYSQ